jgi:hypothetical protein
VRLREIRGTAPAPSDRHQCRAAGAAGTTLVRCQNSWCRWTTWAWRSRRASLVDRSNADTTARVISSASLIRGAIPTAGRHGARSVEAFSRSSPAHAAPQQHRGAGRPERDRLPGSAQRSCQRRTAAPTPVPNR